MPLTAVLQVTLLPDSAVLLQMKGPPVKVPPEMKALAEMTVLPENCLLQKTMLLQKTIPMRTIPLPQMLTPLPLMQTLLPLRNWMLLQPPPDPVYRRSASSCLPYRC